MLEKVRRVVGGSRALVLGLMGAGSVILLWEWLLLRGTLPALSVPRPGEVGARIFTLMGSGEFRSQLLSTIEAWLVALIIATVTMVPIGILCGSIRSVYRPISTVIHAARSIPATALIPVAIIFFGISRDLKVAVAVYAIAWPIILNTMYGVRAVDPVTVTSARSLRWGRFQILARVILPFAAPSIMTGVRIGSALALVVVLSTEFLGATTGIGTVIVRYQQITPPQPDFVYAGISILALLGMASYYFFVEVERRLLPWTNQDRS